ncbi:MAG: hypothetical protein A3C43_06185 [Candidatus Schekmanbacteria bacterium RIFCSPHIGHO2_02_FULL_38_11]|uniref:Uncharacterized protein n=1 Tax=Candidatus Schekmanbacteria bacterium RIFCSPLOWO2_12_FULL_38_15 TaxID=1817883 RepID=A0A1F7SFL0_9BACT|nr:MAG: hypothetical protein A3H37_06005 [Candidatus Schekmanbacteria bacterium RIFCSPLOWO2_02_FULL_38_14]OGL50161.1 MAG: hypothetical protein A3C43_06185 [Candidatus Schekmanbacteria bacterium RIFCSPHIGHO2_02_FULL_38_11]OGL52596.1 MAG: hypothetical protein A3G31_11565 [Candidatus Schekmanbacteria bacterium RIFCSPLOWO2_12_FULL_38_15]
MKKNIFLPALLGISLTLIIPFKSYSEEAVTVTGEIIDTYCYALMGVKGESHKQCAVDCIKKGIAPGLLEDGKDKIYILLPNKDRSPLPNAVIEKAGKKVTVKGTEHKSGGVFFLTVDSVK